MNEVFEDREKRFKEELESMVKDKSKVQDSFMQESKIKDEIVRRYSNYCTELKKQVTICKNVIKNPVTMTDMMRKYNYDQISLYNYKTNDNKDLIGITAQTQKSSASFKNKLFSFDARKSVDLPSTKEKTRPSTRQFITKDNRRVSTPFTNRIISNAENIQTISQPIFSRPNVNKSALDNYKQSPTMMLLNKSKSSMRQSSHRSKIRLSKYKFNRLKSGEFVFNDTVGLH